MAQSDTLVIVSGDDRVVNQGNNTFSVDDTEENDDDSIRGVGTDDGNGIVNSDIIDTGNGKDSITGIATAGDGIVNSGIIYMGNGSDSITGDGTNGFVDIFNTGTIYTGRGSDIVDALNGGFGGDGNVFLGRGNDILAGFGTGLFYGGKGTDTLILPLGSYSVGFATIDETTFVTFTLGDFTMNAVGFEVLQIGDNIYDVSNLPSIVS